MYVYFIVKLSAFKNLTYKWQLGSSKRLTLQCKCSPGMPDKHKIFHQKLGWEEQARGEQLCDRWWPGPNVTNHFTSV